MRTSSWLHAAIFRGIVAPDSPRTELPDGPQTDRQCRDGRDQVTAPRQGQGARGTTGRETGTASDLLALDAETLAARIIDGVPASEHGDFRT